MTIGFAYGVVFVCILVAVLFAVFAVPALM
jgi:uncharacterized integral membrane protein